MGEQGDWDDANIGYQICNNCGWIADELADFTDYIKCPECGSISLDICYE